MKRMRYLTLVTMLAICCKMSAQTAQDTVYLAQDSHPDAGLYLPAPPDTASMAFVDDFQQWIWGKSVRNTERGQQASWESLNGTARMCTVFSEALGITISQQATPALWQLIRRSGNTGSRSTKKPKAKYMRRRPFDRMNEYTWGEFDDYNDLKGNGSYPSAHTARAWAVALTLAQLVPELQDTILRRGFEYGQSRVIVGAHWQSDVDAARLTASATYARIQETEEFQKDFAAANEEYRQLTMTTAPDETVWPSLKRVLDAPIDTASIRYYGDMAHYWMGRAERNTERGQQAIEDAEFGVDVFSNMFSPLAGITLSEEGTPAIYALISAVIEQFLAAGMTMKDDYFRKRPYVQMGEPTSIPEEEEASAGKSSYPSAHALLSWGLALTLTEVMPDSATAILKRGYEIGHSRVIVGYHYASDVQAGRVMASGVLAQLHNRADFVQLIANARQEYARLTSSTTGVDSQNTQTDVPSARIYDMQGRLLDDTTAPTGVYIKGNKKVVQ